MSTVAAPASLEGRHVLRGRGCRGTVMVVDDQPAMAVTTAAMLEELGYDVVLPSNVAGAMLNIGVRDDIDLLIADIVMPGELPGPDLADYAWRRASIPSLLVTGHPRAGATMRSRDRFPVLVKPFGIGSLESCIRSLLDAPRPSA